jgi:hypothetical protein
MGATVLASLAIVAGALLGGCGGVDWGDQSEQLGEKAPIFKVSPAKLVISICEDGTTKNEQIEPGFDSNVRSMAKAVDELFGNCRHLNDHLDVERLDKGWKKLRSVFPDDKTTPLSKRTRQTKFRNATD